MRFSDALELHDGIVPADSVDEILRYREISRPPRPSAAEPAPRQQATQFGAAFDGRHPVWGEWIGAGLAGTDRGNLCHVPHGMRPLPKSTHNQSAIGFLRAIASSRETLEITIRRPDCRHVPLNDSAPAMQDLSSIHTSKNHGPNHPRTSETALAGEYRPYGQKLDIRCETTRAQIHRATVQFYC